MAKEIKDFRGPILFYEPKFYMFSNFSAFTVRYHEHEWPTAEHAYQAAKFDERDIKIMIKRAPSAYEAKKIARGFDDEKREDWHTVKLSIMKEIVHAKFSQHPYIQKKLLETGMREIIENSPEDAFWGWGPDENGENHLGKIWMQLRAGMRGVTF